MLNDLRIVEIGDCMAVQVAGLMLCELGADVLKIEPPGGDPARGSATFANWNRGKRSLVLDLSSGDGPSELAQRLEHADVLLHPFTPVRARALQLDDDTLQRRYPRLVVCGITGSPRAHPDAERSDDELLVAARLGVFYEYDGHRPGPIVWRYRAGGWGTAHLAAAGILSRLVMRLQSGRGGAAHTSILQGLISQLPMVWARNSQGPMPNPPIYPLAARPAAMQLFQCQGGDWLQIMDPMQQFNYALLPSMADILAEGIDLDTPEGKIEAFSRKPLDVWLTELHDNDIAVEPACPLGTLLHHPEAKANGYVVEVDDPHLGHTIQANVPFRVDAPLPSGRPGPRLGEGGNRCWSTSAASVGNNAQPEEVLAGVRVLDCGMFLAGPMGPSMMGDMGANVIKIEPLTGDRMRSMHRYFQAAARSKRSLAIDLTHPEAQPILERLVQWAEVIHHNMRMKGATKVGLSERNIRRMNPKIVFNHVSAYGQRGTRSDWPGYDSIFNALAGWEFENAGAGNRPVFCRPGTMDIGSAMSCLVAIMASLYAKRAHGEVRSTQTSLLGIATFTQGETLILPDGDLSGTYHLTSDQTGFSPYHRIYQCSDSHWIAIAAHTPAQRTALRSILGDDETNFARMAAQRTAADLFDALEAENVPCDEVVFEDAMNRFFDDPLNRRLGLASTLTQPMYGMVEQPGVFWDFGDTPVRLRRCCPTIGQHSDEIMREIGYSDAEIAAFRERKIIG